MGPLASIIRELGQVRKEAAVTDDLSAEMWLIRPPPFQPSKTVESPKFFLNSCQILADSEP
jgi:hypothetical protein